MFGVTVVVPAEAEPLGPQLHGAGGRTRARAGAGSRWPRRWLPESGGVEENKRSFSYPRPLRIRSWRFPVSPLILGLAPACLGFPLWACTCLCEAVVGGSTFMCLSPWLFGEDSREVGEESVFSQYPWK